MCAYTVWLEIWTRESRGNVSQKASRPDTHYIHTDTYTFVYIQGRRVPIVIKLADVCGTGLQCSVYCIDVVLADSAHCEQLC